MCHSQSVRVPCCAQATPHLAHRTPSPTPLPFPSPSDRHRHLRPLSLLSYPPLQLTTKRHSSSQPNFCLLPITTTYTQLLPLCNSLSNLVRRPPTASGPVLSVADNLSSLTTPDHTTQPQQLTRHRDHHRHSHPNRHHALQQHLQRLLHLFPRSFCRA